MNEFILPGHYKLLSAVITTTDGKSIDIVSLMPVFSIEESLDKDSIRGFGTIYDNMGFLEDLPVRGEELLTLEIEDALKQKIVYEFAIYKVTDVEIKNTNDGLIYKIHFMSKASYEAMFSRILEPFNDTTSNIANYIHRNIYPGQKRLIVEPADGIFRCIIPNFTTMQAMNFLALRSYSKKSPSSSFRFFETSESYYFVTDEYLIRRAIENKDGIKEFTYSDALDKSGKDLVSQMKNLVEIKNADRINTVTDLLSGAYRARTIEIDINYRTVTLPEKSIDNEYDYQKEKTKYITFAGKFGGDEDQESHSSNFVTRFNTENERRYLVIKDWDDSGSKQIRGDQFIPEIVMNRVAYRHHLNRTTVYAKSNGRLDLSAGDVINLKIPEFKSTENKTLNKQLSGYYMINDLIHSFERDIHQTNMKLIKYDWGTEE